MTLLHLSDIRSPKRPLQKIPSLVVASGTCNIPVSSSFILFWKNYSRCNTTVKAINTNMAVFNQGYSLRRIVT